MCYGCVNQMGGSFKHHCITNSLLIILIKGRAFFKKNPVMAQNK